MKKPLNLPEFKNEDQERDFWDKIDLSEYFEPSDFKRVVFPNLKATKRLISIRLPDDLIDEVKQKAKKHDVPYCVFRAKVATDSTANLPPIPRQSCH